MKNIIYGLIFGVLVSGCASHGVNRLDAEQLVEVVYARVTSVESITFDSKADEAAVMGGVEGAIFNIGEDSEDVIAGALGGALVAALAVSLEEGSNKGLLLGLQAADKTNYNLTTKETSILLNDCLQMIQGSEVSLKKVEDRFCF